MEIDREIEMLLCMDHQGYSYYRCGKVPGFMIEHMIQMWDILKDDGEFTP